MARRKSYTWPIVSGIVALMIAVISLPQEYRQWAPSFLRTAGLHFGLDLAGGTQLDFRISEREITEQIADLEKKLDDLDRQGASSEASIPTQNQLNALKQQKLNLVEAIRTVLERRINALGVSEATITPSYIGSEKHLLVECPGVVDTQQCIDTVGKTIKLEFKEEHTDADEEYEQSVRDRVASVLKRMSASGDTLAVIGEDMSDELGVSYIDERTYFRDQLPDGLDQAFTLSPSSGVRQFEGALQSPYQTSDGEVAVREVPTIFLAEVTAPRSETGRVITDVTTGMEFVASTQVNARYAEHDEQALTSSVPAEVLAILPQLTPGALQVVDTSSDTRVINLTSYTPGAQEMEASHILVAYNGALSADDSVTRTREEARTRAQDLKKLLDGGQDFAALARAESDGPSSVDGGSLGRFGKGQMVPTFEQAAFSLTKGEISSVVETQFGFHIIRADSIFETSQNVATYDELIFTGETANTDAITFISNLENGVLERTEEVATIRTLFFSLLPTGWKDTALDGKHFQTATVTMDPVTNLPIVQITFDEEGGKLFQELTAQNIGKRIAIFVGGQLVSAPTVQAEISGGVAVITGSSTFDEARLLAQDLNTGAIPAPIFLSGQHTVEATLGAEALHTSLKAALIGIVILIVYMIVMYRILGLLAGIALCVYAVIFLAILKMPLFLVSNTYIVLTLAGMAGIILSIGMAVDANVLIFERIKEELRKGKLLHAAIETGFERAWPSIRDGNVSTFITCAILFVIGTSIVRGFAVTLGMGVLISMFSAIVITKILARRFARTPLAANTVLLGVKQDDNK